MKKVILIVFVIVAAAQLIVPVKMILGKENIISTGKEYKFRTAPVDPYDPFRGKYITLNFDANHFETSDDDFWKQDDDVYVILTKDSQGFAEIMDITKQPPLHSATDYVKAKIRYAYGDRVTIDYSFNKFYMEETKAPRAEDVYRNAARDTSQRAYALVSIKDGEAVLKNVFINDVPISEIVKKNAK